MQKKSRLVISLATNLGLLGMGSVMAFSGFSIQFSYHMGHHGSIDNNNPVLGMYYLGWSNIHKISIIIVSILIIVHITLHWNWYTTVVQKRLFAKNNLVITLTIIFVIVAITGYIPWLMKLAGGSDVIAKIFIEVHDKITFVLFAYLIVHVTQRNRWFIASFEKTRKFS